MSSKIDLVLLVGKIATSRGASLNPLKGNSMDNLEVIDNGAIVINNGLIEAVGSKEEILKEIDLKSVERIIDKSNSTCLPGLIDPHTHTVFAGYREDEFAMRIAGTTYMEILKKGGGILDTVKATRAMSYEDLLEKTRCHLDEILEGGTTTIEIKSGYGLDFTTEIKMLKVIAQLQKEHPIDIVPTFMGAHALPPEYSGRPQEFIDFMADEVLPYVVQEGLAEYCDIFCEEGVFTIEQSKNLLQKALQLGLKVRFHADEMVSSGGAQLAAELGAQSADHLLEVSEKGIKEMAAKNVIATLLPATPFTLMKTKYAPAREMINSGVAVALASDFNPGSSPTHSLPLIMTLACLNLKLTPEEAINGVTINAAHSLGRGQEIGSIEVGKKADLAIFSTANHRCIPYFFGVNHIDMVIKSGQVVVDKGKII